MLKRGVLRYLMYNTYHPEDAISELTLIKDIPWGKDNASRIFTSFDWAGICIARDHKLIQKYVLVNQVQNNPEIMKLFNIDTVENK